MKVTATILLLSILTACGGGVALPPTDPAHQVVLKHGDLRVIIADNNVFGVNRAPEGEPATNHQRGYHGIAVLLHKQATRNLFVDRYAGFNHEHIYDGRKWFDGDTPAEKRRRWMEPRTAPITVRRLSERSAELHQPATPLWQLESRTTFTLEKPHYIDVTYECTPHADTFDGGYIGLFWANYISGPPDKAIYFIGGAKDETRVHWARGLTREHNQRSTFRYMEEEQTPDFAPDHPPTLYTNFSPIHFSQPFFYGICENMVYAVMFDRTDGLRFAHSPTGAGANNPAWDWQWYIFDYEVGETYRYNARIVYKPWVSEEDILQEYEAWSGKRVVLN